MDRRLLPVALIKQVLQRPARPPPLLLRSPIPHFQPFTCRQRRLESARLFSSVPRRQDTTSTPKNVATRSEPLNPSKRARRKKRTTAAKAPLAKIAKDAEVSHLRGVEHGSMRHRDPRVKVTCIGHYFKDAFLTYCSGSSQPALRRGTTWSLRRISSRGMAWRRAPLAPYCIPRSHRSFM